jgi:pimeloyl-ACP methyl ester carboxylesterase
MRIFFLLIGIILILAGTGELRAQDRRKAREQARQEKKQREEEKKKRNDSRTSNSDKNKVVRKKHVIIKDGDARRPEGKINCLEKEFTLQTGIETEPEVKLTCLVPVDGSGKPTAGAHDVVFYSPYAGARKALEKRVELRRYSRALGMTIFTIEIITDTKYLGNPEKYYCYEVSGWHEVAIAAWKKVLEEFQLEKRKLLIMGDSVGGSYAQQIAARYPDEIEAVTFTGGRLYGNIRKNNVNWLAMSIWKCPGMQDTQDLIQQYRELGVNVLQTEAPPLMPSSPAQHLFHHTPSRITFEIMEDYLAGIRDLRTKNGGTVPPVSEWPARETIFEQEYVFPSKAVAASWKKLPHAMRREVALRDRQPIVLEPAVVTDGTPVVIYAHDAEIMNTILEDNFCFLAQQGFICVGFNPGASTADYQFLVRYIRFHFPKRKVYAIGAYNSGERMAAGLLSAFFKVERITLLNTDIDSLISALTIGRIQNSLRIPIEILQDIPLEDVPKNRYNIEARTFNRNREFGGAWFNALAEGLTE